MIVGVPKRIKRVMLAFLSPDEIRKMSSTKIITADTYDDDGFPIEMGLMNPRLGVIEPGLRCKTCGRKVDECPGHFGHIDLAMPVIHEGYPKTLRDFVRREIWHGKGNFASLETVLRSKVAMLAVAFLLLHAVALVALLCGADRRIAVAGVTLVSVLCLTASVMKYHRFPMSIPINGCLYYLYLWGRGLALVGTLYSRAAKRMRSKGHRE